MFSYLPVLHDLKQLMSPGARLLICRVKGGPAREAVEELGTVLCSILLENILAVYIKK